MTEEKFCTGETAAVDEASDESETVETARANTDDNATAPARRPITTDESSVPALASMVIQHHELQFGAKIGGGFGIVFSGTWRFQDMAIKEIDGITGKAAHGHELHWRLQLKVKKTKVKVKVNSNFRVRIERFQFLWSASS